MESRSSITEVALLYKTSTRTLRYYEEVGILSSHRKVDSKYREYDKEQCERLEVILLMRRLSFSIKLITELLGGCDTNFLVVLEEKILQSSKQLLEIRETNRLLCDLMVELSKKPTTTLSAENILSKYIYLTNKTERVIKMKPWQEEKYLVAIASPIALDVCGENAGNLIEKVRTLRLELEKEGVDLPPIRIRDNIDLPENQVFIIWGGKEIWRKNFKETDAIACANEIVKKIKLEVK